jgi:hypothetical protein
MEGAGAVGPSPLQRIAPHYRSLPRFWCKLASLLGVLASCGPEGRMFESCWARQHSARSENQLAGAI